MQNPTSHPVLPIRSTPRRRERGMALVLVLLLLLLVSAIGLGLIYTSNTESTINSNYRDSQLAFFAMRAGLEEARDRMRGNSVWPVALPTTLPPNANSIIYIRNPAAGEVVDPKLSTGGSNTAFFDDEFCHETFVGDGLAGAAAGVPCPAAQNTNATGAVAAYINSISPGTGTASAMKYKWARITLKENGTFSNGAVAARVDPGVAANVQVCYQSMSGKQAPITSIAGGAYATCDLAEAAGQDASPVYVVTSLAVTPQLSRRIGQYEVAKINLSAPPLALGMDGPAAVYNPVANSNVLFMDGTDDNNGYANPAGCTKTMNTVPAITAGDPAGVTNIDNAISGVNPPGPDRSSHYTGGGLATPSVTNGAGTTFSGEWSTPSQLDAMVTAIANEADKTYDSGNGCAIGSPCSPASSYGSDANPQITYVNGDFNMGNASGAGVLVVTGTLFFNGNANFDGLILVIGQGIMNESGGGNGGFNGSVFLARTHSATAPYAELATLGTPTIAWNGGGNAFIQYNSCWAKIGDGKVFVPIATREEMY